MVISVLFFCRNGPSPASFWMSIVSGGSSVVPNVIASVSTVDFSDSIAPLRPFIFAFASACADPCLVTEWVILSHALGPAFISAMIDRVASAPKIWVR
jgi:hypothetical protein